MSLSKYIQINLNDSVSTTALLHWRDYVSSTDVTFGTVWSISDDEDPPVLGNKVSLDSFTHQLLLEPVHSPILHDECLSPSE